MKKPNLETKVAKYYMSRKAGKSKKESAITAGYSKNTALGNTNKIEMTQEFQTLQTYFKDELKTKISLSEIADALIDNIVQKDMKVIDRGSRNKAIEIALDKLEPDNKSDYEEEKVIIVMQQ